MKMLYLSREQDGRVFAEGKCVIERYGKDWIKKFILIDAEVDDMYKIVTHPNNYDVWFIEVRIGDKLFYPPFHTDLFISETEKL